MRIFEVEITGLNKVPKQKPNKGGSTIVADFDCKVGGFLLIGCALVRTAKNGMTVWAPKLERPDNVRRAVTIVDDHLRAAMLQAAREAYIALGGTDAEWIPRAQSDGDAADNQPRRDEGVTRFLNA